MSGHVLCAVDGSIESRHALRLADGLAVRAARGLEVVDVRGAARERELEAASESAAVLVLGARGPRALRRMVRGSLCGALGPAAACPLLSVPRRRPSAWPHGSLLCGIRDIRDLAVAATAASWADELGVELVLGSVVTPPRATSCAIAAPPPALVCSMSERLAIAREALEEVATEVAPLIGVHPRVRVLAGSLRRGLCEIAEAEVAEMTVVGPSRRGLLGTASPAPYLLRHSQPVMTCPSRDGVVEHALEAAGLSRRAAGATWPRRAL